ncbi:MAG TPA: ABC transporter permease [Acetobacteraceae bacterium]|jgi:taurine transport system permease protein|nr:ABC transporter permease [Acetobacteraceae bacterium]
MHRNIARLFPSPGGTASAAFGFAILLALWWAATDLLHLRPVILPRPLAVWQQLVAMAAAGELATNVLTSLWELLWGFLIGSVAGILSGIALARSAWLRSFLDPIIETFRFIVPFSLVPLVVVWFGVSPIGKVFVVAYACYFVVAINTAAAIREIDPLILKAAQMLGISGARLLGQVMLPAALPRILTGLQLALAYAWVSVIAAEYVGASAGLGYLITNAQSGLETAKVMAGMVVIGAIGCTFSVSVGVIRRVLVPYAAEAGW